MVLLGVLGVGVLFVTSTQDAFDSLLEYVVRAISSKNTPTLSCLAEFQGDGSEDCLHLFCDHFVLGIVE